MRGLGLTQVSVAGDTRFDTVGGHRPGPAPLPTPGRSLRRRWRAGAHRRQHLARRPARAGPCCCASTPRPCASSWLRTR
ncbi:MAG: hypothetical protein WKG07_47420 [Hymenobacter sp.]